jgi:hypothetical protein
VPKLLADRALFGGVLVGALAGSSSDERVAWERAMLVAAAR